MFPKPIDGRGDMVPTVSLHCFLLWGDMVPTVSLHCFLLWGDMVPTVSLHCLFSLPLQR